MDRCRREAPPLLAADAQQARCWLFSPDSDDTTRATAAHPSKES